jgi:plastocyanin
VKAGTKIVWNWVGTSNPHSIQMLGKTSPEQTSGSFERVMDQSGSNITYQCGVHKEAMTARIVIE